MPSDNAKTLEFLPKFSVYGRKSSLAARLTAVYEIQKQMLAGIFLLNSGCFHSRGSAESSAPLTHLLATASGPFKKPRVIEQDMCRKLIFCAVFCVLVSRPDLLRWGCARTIAAPPDQRTQTAIQQSLDYLVSLQKRQGYWEANQGQYRVAMTALAGTAMLAEGSTATSGRYAKPIRLAVDYLLSMSRPNGLIGYREDFHYTYGHGYSMVFLSQVYGEEEDERRREELRAVLTRAVQFCADAQTSRGGWGYVSASEGNDFDEGSTCITQVQGLRACRNAGIPVSKEIIDRAKRYIEECTTSEGGVQYSIRGGGARAPITAAALAAMFNAGEYDTEVTKRMREYCRQRIWPERSVAATDGFWHYMHFYFAQVVYRTGGDDWNKYRGELHQKLLQEMQQGGGWSDQQVGPVYVTAVNCIMLQLDRGFLPIYQR